MEGLLNQVCRMREVVQQKEALAAELRTDIQDRQQTLDQDCKKYNKLLGIKSQATLTYLQISAQIESQESESRKLDDELADLSQQLPRLESECQTLTDQKDAMTASLSKMQVTLDSHIASTTVHFQNQKLEEVLQKLHAENDDLERKLKFMPSPESMTEEIETAKKQLQVLRDRKSQSEKERDVALKRHEQRKKELDAMIFTLKKEILENKRQIDSARLRAAEIENEKLGPLQKKLDALKAARRQR